MILLKLLIISIWCVVGFFGMIALYIFVRDSVKYLAEKFRRMVEAWRG